MSKYAIQNLLGHPVQKMKQKFLIFFCISEKLHFRQEKGVAEPHLNSNSFSWPRPKDFIKLCFVATWISRNSEKRLEARTGSEASNLG